MVTIVTHQLHTIRMEQRIALCDGNGPPKIARHELHRQKRKKPRNKVANDTCAIASYVPERKMQ